MQDLVKVQSYYSHTEPRYGSHAHSDFTVFILIAQLFEIEISLALKMSYVFVNSEQLQSIRKSSKTTNEMKKGKLKSLLIKGHDSW